MPFGNQIPILFQLLIVVIIVQNEIASTLDFIFSVIHCGLFHVSFYYAIRSIIIQNFQRSLFKGHCIEFGNGLFIWLFDSVLIQPFQPFQKPSFLSLFDAILCDRFSFTS